MSNFLANILSRHSNTEHIIQPRGKSVFEQQQPFSEPLFSPSESEYAHSNPSENNLIKTPVNQVTSNESTRDVVIQRDNEGGERNMVGFNPKQFNKPENKTRESIVEKVKWNAETFFHKKEELSQEKGLLKTNIISSPVLGKTQNKLPDHVSNEHTTDLRVQELDAQSTPAGFLDRRLVEPKKEIVQRISTSLNISTQNDNDIALNGGKSTSNGQPPTIKIHIGRIDIKAVKQSETKRPQAPKQHKSGMSLEQFLKTREGK